MNTKTIPCKNGEGFSSLGEYVSHLREARGYTLRDVVEEIETAITHKGLEQHCSLSRGYLSNLEADKYANPSPFKLEALAYVYQVPYDTLLRKAGYMKQAAKIPQQDTAKHLLLLAVQELTPTEMDALFAFVDFLKAKRTKRCRCQ